MTLLKQDQRKLDLEVMPYSNFLLNITNIRFCFVYKGYHKDILRVIDIIIFPFECHARILL